MEKPFTLKPLSIQDENSALHLKKVTADSKSSKSMPKKGGAALESRKALNDITNKSFIHVEASSQKKSLQNKKCTTVEDGVMRCHDLEAEALCKKKSSTNEQFNIAEERFLHDHNKCIDAQKMTSEVHFLNTVLPGHDAVDVTKEQSKSYSGMSSISSYPEPEELPMLECSDWFKSWWISPPSSPMNWDSPPSSPFTWSFDPIELTLKEENWEMKNLPISTENENNAIAPGEDKRCLEGICEEFTYFHKE